MLNKIKACIFGSVILVWGILILYAPHLLLGVPTLSLWFQTLDPFWLGTFFTFAGGSNIISKCNHFVFLAAFTNVLVAFSFFLMTLAHLYMGVFFISWIAFAGITLNLLINAYLIISE